MNNYSHGGDVYTLADVQGRPVSDFLDFSANINPLGPPSWLKDFVLSQYEMLVHYPQPQAQNLILAASRHFNLDHEEIIAGNGSTEILYNLPRITHLKNALIPVPSYVDYEKVCAMAGLNINYLTLDPSQEFILSLSRLDKALIEPAIVFIGQPNNPTGRTISSSGLRNLAQEHPRSLFVIDEAFADFIPDLDRLYIDRPANVIVLLSLTKFYAIPGLRAGLAFGSPENISELKKLSPPWSVNQLAQSAAEKLLKDDQYRQKSVKAVQHLRRELYQQLKILPGLTVFPSEINFFLCRLDRSDLNVSTLHERLLQQEIIIRQCFNFRGLDNSYFRAAVRNQEQNKRLVQALTGLLDTGRSRYYSPLADNRTAKTTQTSKSAGQVSPSGTPALMFQGLSSNAGKSVLAAALCRIFLQDGYRVAPFKAQNMSLNSFVTRSGGEMGRAQVLQAQACRLEPDVLMNPLLLKPSTETGSQVILLGHPVDNMDVQTYVRYKPQVIARVQEAYDNLASSFDIMVLEGAGSPAEINLKDHDLTNMSMARYAQAKVLLVGDIDRGGVFASFVGTLELLDKWERDLVSGLVINRFRGDQSLLGPAMQPVQERTGKPFLGVVPYITDLGLPEEDSVTFKAGWDKGKKKLLSSGVHFACVDLAHISNFTDLDPLLAEPDVRLSIVKKISDLDPPPDVLIIPGSKNVLSDLKHLEKTGLDRAILQLAQSELTELVGICGGFQILGHKVMDPLGIESRQQSSPGLGLLPVITELEPQKFLSQVKALHIPSDCQLKGYEIHHGRTWKTSDHTICSILSEDQREIGFSLPEGLIWGTYLHGIFDEDLFRRWYIDRIRIRKGLEPLKGKQTSYDLEDHLDRLAEKVRQSLDLDSIYRFLGIL